MVSSEQIQEVIYKGIVRFEKKYGISRERISLIFQVQDTGNDIVYTTCIDGQKKHIVSLTDLIGFNVYNFVVSSHIKKLLKKLALYNELPVNVINLKTCIRNNKVYITLNNKENLIREVNPEELKS